MCLRLSCERRMQPDERLSNDSDVAKQSHKAEMVEKYRKREWEVVESSESVLRSWWFV